MQLTRVIKNRKRVCALVPAAGRGSRLKQKMPKILVPIVKEKRVWHILYEKLSPFVDQIHVVLSPKGISLFKQQMEKDHLMAGVSTSIQTSPIGMGDAIFGAYDFWKDYESIFIIWGDQVFVSTETIQETINNHFSSNETCLTIPISLVDRPYVQYLFNDDLSTLKEVKQSREGDTMGENGFTDVGVFCLSTINLIDLWHTFLENVPRGLETGEINFLPFLSYLSTEACWNVKTVFVKDPDESRGINTPQDMDFFRKKFESLHLPGRF